MHILRATSSYDCKFFPFGFNCTLTFISGQYWRCYCNVNYKQEQQRFQSVKEREQWQSCSCSKHQRSVLTIIHTRVDMVGTNHNKLLTLWRHMPMGQFRANIFWYNLLPLTSVRQKFSKIRVFKVDSFILPLFLVPKLRSVAQNEWKKHPYIFFLLLVQK